MADPVTVIVRDETTAGETLRELELQLLDERTTVRELIRARVHQEVRRHNAEKATIPFRGLVQPSAQERDLNGPPKHRRVDANVQTDVAVEAFARGSVLLLVDDSQVTELDDEVSLRPGSTVSFLKLVPLVGG
jgi:hypothetical protein